MKRRIRLTERYDDRWEARDLDAEVSAVGDSRREALDQLDDVVAAGAGDGGRKPTAKELRAAGVDPAVNRVRAHLHEELDGIREESIFADDAQAESASLNEDGDRTLDEVFAVDSEEEPQKRILRREHPSGWLSLTQHESIPILVDALLDLPPDHEFTIPEFAEHAGVPHQTVEDYTNLLLEVELIEAVPNTSSRRYRVANSSVVQELVELNSALNNVSE